MGHPSPARATFPREGDRGLEQLLHSKCGANFDPHPCGLRASIHEAMDRAGWNYDGVARAANNRL